MVVRERRPGSTLDTVGFGASATASFLALLTDLAGAGAVSLNQAALVLDLITVRVENKLPPSLQLRLSESFSSRLIPLAPLRSALKVWLVLRQG